MSLVINARSKINAKYDTNNIIGQHTILKLELVIDKNCYIRANLRYRGNILYSNCHKLRLVTKILQIINIKNWKEWPSDYGNLFFYTEDASIWYVYDTSLDQLLCVKRGIAAKFSFICGKSTLTQHDDQDMPSIQFDSSHMIKTISLSDSNPITIWYDNEGKRICSQVNGKSYL